MAFTAYYIDGYAVNFCYIEWIFRMKEKMGKKSILFVEWRRLKIELNYSKT